MSRLGLRTVFAICVVTLSIGCASLDARRDVFGEQRVALKWDAMVAGDYSLAYSYLTPGYRARINEDVFESRFSRTDWLDYRIVGIECSDDVCEVDLEADYEFDVLLYGPQRGVQELREQWLWTGDGWYHRPEK